MQTITYFLLPTSLHFCRFLTVVRLCSKLFPAFQSKNTGQVSQSIWRWLIKPQCTYSISRTNVASVGNVFNDTRKVKVLSLPETIKEKSTFPANALRRKRRFFLYRFR